MFCLKLNDKLIERVNSLKYLSFDLKNNKNIFGIKNNINDIVIRTNVIIKNFKNINTGSKIKLFNSQCLFLYGAELWNLECNDMGQLKVS